MKRNLNSTVPYKDEAVCVGGKKKTCNCSTKIKQSIKSGGGKDRKARASDPTMYVDKYKI